MELREPTLNEQRCIVRHELGFYRGLVTAAIYELSDAALGGNEPHNVLAIFGPGIRECVERHPILGVVIDGPDTEKPRFRRLQQISLPDHLRRLERQHLGVEDGEEDEVIEKAVEYALNDKFDDVRKVPPWSVYIVSLKGSGSTGVHAGRYLVVYSFSHSHGDGLSGLLFHKTLVSALMAQPSEKGGLEVSTGQRPLPPTLGLLPISWSYLLGVLVKEFMPWLHSWWNPSVKGKPWTGSFAFCDDTFKTATKLVTVDSPTLTMALSSWRQHGIKLTALLHLLIVRSLTTELKNANIDPGSFISGTPIDLRKVFGLPSGVMGVNASAVAYQHFSVEAGCLVSDQEIAAAQEQTRMFAHASSTQQDQVIGLLKYATPLRRWHLGKMGKPRDTSYEVSNVMVLSPEHSSNIRLQGVFFAQPADAGGVPISFNVVGLTGGALSMEICWQVGALGLVGPADKIEVIERDFVARVATTFENEFRHLSSGPAL